MKKYHSLQDFAGQVFKTAPPEGHTFDLLLKCIFLESLKLLHAENNIIDID